MISDRCLSVTVLYCGQTVRWIKVKLGTVAGLGTGHIALDGDPAPNFRLMSTVAKRSPISAITEHLLRLVCRPNGYCLPSSVNMHVPNSKCQR